MKIVYFVKGRKVTTNKSNKDLTILSSYADNRKTITITAKKDIELVKATDVIPFHITFKDRYFLNGYQSWTDTKEFSLFTRLRNIKKSPHIISAMYAMRSYGDSLFYKSFLF